MQYAQGSFFRTPSSLQILGMHTTKQNRYGVNPQEKLLPVSDLERL